MNAEIIIRADDETGLPVVTVNTGSAYIKTVGFFLSDKLQDALMEELTAQAGPEISTDSNSAITEAGVMLTNKP